MTFRKIVSPLIAVIFLIMAVSGIILWFGEKNLVSTFLHSFFGLLFLISAVFHVRKNFRSLRNSVSPRISILIFSIIGSLLFAIISGFTPFDKMMAWNARINATKGAEIKYGEYQVYQMKALGEYQLTLDFLKGQHFWHPQVAVWLEDTSGKYLETIFITAATATGTFYGSRTKENFKEFDANLQDDGSGYRRVNALPYWSHKRGHQYNDGGYSPTQDQPLPDGITGATPQENFYIKSRSNTRPVKVMVEVNVAFDDNRYYSEYDYPEDEAYHGGAGLLGQPSLIYQAIIHPDEGKQYQVMQLMGRGHHSGQSGEIYDDLETITTAKEIFERIVVGFKSK